VTQKTAWFMLHRIRLAMQTKTFTKRFKGEVEVDETFIGGRARFMHKDKKARVITSTGPAGKAAVIGLLERHGPGHASRVRAGVVGTIRRRVLHGAIHATCEPGSEIFTDDLDSYKKLDEQFIHKVIDHAECYAKGNIHTNGLENFWSLLKRGIKGTYVAVEPFHLFRYLDEQVFRFNNRKTKDVARFIDAVGSIVAKRLTYSNLTGAGVAPATT
jgi:transposase-like protein